MRRREAITDIGGTLGEKGDDSSLEEVASE